MRLELIVPAINKSAKKPKKTLCPPMAPAAIAALTPPHWEVSITDENVSVIDFENKADIVGITVLTATA